MASSIVLKNCNNETRNFFLKANHLMKLCLNTKNRSLINCLESICILHSLKFPFSLRQIAEPKISDSHANQSQRRMPNRRRHFANLPVFAFNQFQTDPAMGNGFAKTNG